LVCATVDVSFLPLFFCACFLIGAASSGLATGGDLLVATYLSGTARAKMLGFQSAFGGMLASGAAYVSGHIADAHGWHASFGQFVAAGTLTCAAAVYVVSVTGSETVHAPHLLDRVTLLFPLAPLYAAIFFSTMVAMTTAAHVPLLMAEAGATSVSATSIVIAMQGAFCMVAALSYGFIQARIGERWTLCAAIVIGCGGFLLTGLSGAAVSYGMGAAMIGAAVGLSQPYFLGSVIRSAPMAVRPQACGLFGTATFLGAFANPFIMAPVRNVLGLHGLYIATSFACAVIGFGALRMTGRAKLVENTYV
jgi:MFS family permease